MLVIDQVVARNTIRAIEKAVEFRSLSSAQMKTGAEFPAEPTDEAGLPLASETCGSTTPSSADWQSGSSSCELMRKITPIIPLWHIYRVILSR
jgi:hypothetical protein